MLNTCGSFINRDSSTANLYQQVSKRRAVCALSSDAYKLPVMKKPIRTPLTPEQDAEAIRLKSIFAARKDAARARGQKLTQEDVAALCGWGGQSAVSQYMNGKIALNLEALHKLAKALDFEPSEVSPRLAGEPTRKSNVSQLKQESNVAPAPRLEGYVPVISWVQAGAWTEVCNFDDLSDEQVPRPPACSESTFALRVKGQSMAPRYEPGLIIYVDPDVVPFDGDDVVALLVDDNEATFKQYVEEPGGSRMLKARNPGWPEPWVPINGNCQIVGVVIATMWLRAPRAG
ncbi:MULTISPECIES: S24 family peptidase [unclassified Halomonas]|uniref:LexA family transcriptional regulator n=1 Tax=unclassified Halomonas TaxID=2609666 RepID=UPI002076A0F9|nr:MULTISPECIES: S24 family peptidase [unclassified Halomonas]